MSSRRSSSTSRGSSRMITEDELNDLLLKLQRLVPDLRRRSSRGSMSKTLKETCIYIRSLQKEVDNLSDKISELMSSMEITSVEADALRGLLLQHH
ncbi:hypothetical protein MKX01_024322 [Papaver californicum]|nr:hypothetical protein MKX01_024322 [Papaver californicum]